jgi:hypothetical protein
MYLHICFRVLYSTAEKAKSDVHIFICDDVEFWNLACLEVGALE